ncbi:MAG TPA: RNA pseudouridine synthase, partial [Kofleriaceae bacterium]|nr:RNA pseudouridine synthase [Kofleriaceae bacterium]
EAGHPLVGEPVYVRDYHGPIIASPRLLLHAETLGFDHPVTGARIELASPLPPDFAAVLQRL